MGTSPASRSPWARTLYRARTRCRNPRDIGYRNYGGRGIKCLLTMPEIKALWERDGADKLEVPSIDRINNDGHYEFANCRFIRDAGERPDCGHSA